MSLSKYKLKNIGKDQKFLVSSKLPAGKVAIDKITDDQAELLYNDGKSQYVELAKSAPEKAEVKK